MASKEDLSEQLALTQKLAAAVDQMARSLSRIDASYDTQIAQVEKLTQAIEKLNGMDLGSLNQVKLDAAQKELKNTEKQTTSLTGKIKDLAGVASKKFPTSMVVAGAALEGFAQGIENLVSLGKGLFGFTSGLVDAAVNIAASIIAIPFKMFSGLVDMAAKAGGGSNELAQAIENLRKEMGDLKGPGASAVITTTKTLQGFSDTGLSAYRVFGTLAERLEHMTKVATAMGATFGVLRKEFEQAGGYLLGFQKGLGVSDEGMKAIGDRAITMGKPMTQVFLDMTKQTLALGKAFDVDQKLIGRDMSKAIADVKHFGQISAKEIGVASVYARKLGVELDKIVGTLDQFETFDTAAESAAKLSQSFGVTVDAFKMMEAQSPADQVDMLRKSFAAAGQDASTFNRQQLKLLATTTGLDEATAKQVFSAKNQGVSLDEIKKKSETAEKKTLTQAEAMSKLADSIERMVKSGGAMEGGFFKMFMKGILGGIQSSKEFREVIMNIRKALQQTYMIGVELGRSLVKMIPDLSTFLGGLKDFFDPTKFSKLFGGISKAVKDFISNPSMSFKDLMDRLQKDFFGFFDSENPAGKKMLESFKNIFKKVAKLAAEGIKWISEKVADGLKTLTEFIKDPAAFLAKGTEAGGGAFRFVVEALTPIAKAIKDAAIVMWPALRDLMTTVWGKFVDWFKSDGIKLIKPAIPYIVAALFGPSLMQALLGVGTSMLSKAVFGMISRAFAGPAAEAAGEAAAKGLGGVLSKSFGGLGRFLGPIGIAVAIGMAAVGVSDALDKFEKDLTPKFGKTEAKLGAASAGIIHAITFGLLPEGIESTIAESIAGLANTVFKAVEGYFGTEFTKKLKDYIASGIDVFASLGSLIKALFTGDEDKIADAFTDLGEKLLIYLKNAFLWMIEEIPTLAVHIAKFAFKLQGMIFHVIGKILAKGENIPILGPLFKALSKLFEFAGDVYEWIGKMFGKLADIFKKDGVLGSIAKGFGWVWDQVTGAWDAVVNAIAKGIGAVVDFFSGLWDGIKKIWGAVTGFFNDYVWKPISDVFTMVAGFIKEKFELAWKGAKIIWNAVSGFFNDYVWKPLKLIFDTIVDIITSPFDEAWEKVKRIFSWETVSKVFNAVVDGISTALNKLLKIPVFSQLIDVAKKVFDIGSPSKVFMKIGGDLADGMDKGLENMPDIVNKHMSAAAQAASQAAPQVAAQVQKASPSANVGSAGAKGALDSAVAMGQQMDALQKRASDISANAQAFADSISKGGIAPALKAVEDMVTAVNQMNDALSNLPKVDINAKLGAVAKAAGLGARGTWTIKNKDIVLNVNLSVSMNVDEVEKIMVMRKSSIIRDRLNFATAADTAGKPGAPSIPETLDKNLPNIQKGSP